MVPCLRARTHAGPAGFAHPGRPTSVPSSLLNLPMDLPYPTISTARAPALSTRASSGAPPAAATTVADSHQGELSSWGATGGTGGRQPQTLRAPAGLPITGRSHAGRALRPVSTSAHVRNDPAQPGPPCHLALLLLLLLLLLLTRVSLNVHACVKSSTFCISQYIRH